MYVRACVYVNMYVCMYYVRMYVCMYVRYVCMHVYACIQMCSPMHVGILNG